MPMNVLNTISGMRQARGELGKLALVPTMGALHAGHLSLIEVARGHAQHVIVSIFVNPTQFGANEDFNRYPRPIDQDLEKCEQAGVDLVFHPAPEEVYRPGDADVVVDLPQLSAVLEGKHRPGHFKGVCQVVAKLFNIIRPDVACFGEKDFQQLRILTAMVESLNFNIDMVACPTLRDPDGMAMSSRNQYLSAEEREKGLSISRGLRLAQAEFDAGVRQTNRLLTTMQKAMLEKHLSIDYVASVDPLTLKTVEVITSPTVMAVAARVGKTRLIDNIILRP